MSWLWSGAGTRLPLLTALVLAATGCFEQSAPQPGPPRPLVVAAVWGLHEEANFKAVLDNLHVPYQYVQTDPDIDTTLTRLRNQGKLPDVAILPTPGLLPKLLNLNLMPLDPVTTSFVKANYDPVWREAASVNGKLYGVFFKATNKSIVWYRPEAFSRAGISPPATWTGFLEAADRLEASHAPAVVIGGKDGWPLTDWFENVYLSQAGPTRYDQLARHEIKWTDPSVKEALRTLAQLWGRPDLLKGGTSGSLDTPLLNAATGFIHDTPAAGMLYEGDFVENYFAAIGARPGSDYDLFRFPAAGPTQGVIVGGDMAVLLRDSEEGRLLMRYLASPEAAIPWIQSATGAGFYSPNRQVPLWLYPTPRGRIGVSAARLLAEAPTVRFDMSDTAPPIFGSDTEWTDLARFFSNPSDVDGAVTQLENDAARAYSSGFPPPLPTPSG